MFHLLISFVMIVAASILPVGISAASILLVEDFEAGHLNNYKGQKNECYSVTTDRPIVGTRSLMATGVGWGDTEQDPLAYCTMVSTAGLAYYPQVGDTFQIKIRVDTSVTYGAFIWGVQSDEYPWPGYRLRIDTGGTPEVELEKVTLSGPIEQHFISPENTLSHITCQPKTNETYTVTVTWKANGEMPYVITDSAGKVLARDDHPKADTEYKQGGIGFMSTSSQRDYPYNRATFDDIKILNRPSAGEDTQVPSVPTNLSAIANSSSQIILSWGPSTDNVGITGYRLERCQGVSCTNFTQIAISSNPTYTDTGLTPNTSYRYRVQAIDAAGNLSGYSGTASETTLSTSEGDITTGLLTHYTFDGTTSDAVGENHGIAAGGPQYVTGTIGLALQFDGMDDYVIKTSPIGLPTGKATRTLSMWVRFNGTRLKDIFGGYGNTSNCQNFELGFGNLDQSKIGFYGWSSCDYTTAINSTTYADNTFHHIAVTYDGTTLRFYVDGTLRDTAVRTLDTKASTICVGGEVNGTNCDRWFSGAIDDFRIYSRALSQEDIAALHHLGTGGNILSSLNPPENLRILK